MRLRMRIGQHLHEQMNPDNGQCDKQQVSKQKLRRTLGEEVLRNQQTIIGIENKHEGERHQQETDVTLPRNRLRLPSRKKERDAEQNPPCHNMNDKAHAPVGPVRYL